MTTLTTYPLRLPKSIKAAVERISKQDGTSMNQFVATAVAEKIAAMNAVAFFEERRARGDMSALTAMLGRSGGQAPREGDEMPPGIKRTAAPKRKKPRAR